MEYLTAGPVCDTAVVFLPGLPGSCESFRAVLGTLAQYAVQGIAVTLRGFRPGDAAMSDLSVAHWTQDVRRLLEDHARVRTVVLVAMTQSIPVALQLALVAPSLVGRIVFVDPALGASGRASLQQEMIVHKSRNQANWVKHVDKKMVHKPEDSVLQRLAIDLSAGSFPLRVALCQAALDNNWSQLQALPSTTALAVVVGDGTTVTTVADRSEGVAKWRRSVTTTCIPDCGMLVPVEQPRALACAILGLLAL